MTHLFFLLVLLPQLPGLLCTVTTVRGQTVLAGQSISVPCHYSPEYISNVKYWCQGSTKDFCTTLARTDQPDHIAPFSKARIMIADDPTQKTFTVTMHELKDADTGWYWCGVEIGGIWSVDKTATLYITVIQGIKIKGSIQNNAVTAEEGSSVTVQCLYSEKHRVNEKKWCRSGNVHLCKITKNGMFNSTFLLISDDRKDTVTVTMRQLKLQDAGWYWCGASEHQVSVRVLVIPRLRTTDLVKALDSHSFWPTLLIGCGAPLILLTAILVTRLVWKNFQL